MSGMLRKYRRAKERRRQGYEAELAGSRERLRRMERMGVDQIDYKRLGGKGSRRVVAGRRVVASRPISYSRKV